MKKPHILAASAAILLSAAGPSLAASQARHSTRSHSGNTARTYRDPAPPPYAYGPGAYGSGFNAYARGTTGFGNPYGPGAGRYQYNPNQPPNLPYPDRPYGAPDRW